VVQWYQLAALIRQLDDSVSRVETRGSIALTSQKVTDYYVCWCYVEMRCEMDLLETAEVCALVLQIRKKKIRRHYWVHLIYSCRLLKEKFCTLYENLCEHPIKFFLYFHMNILTFDELIGLIRPAVSYRNTNFRLCIPPEEKIAVTIS
jgi:hypothetical protein